jgi:DNA (cytosine-5)-methyltransferase 1
MNELALFAGAGGGLLASRLLGWRTICAVEIDKYCQRILLQRQRDGCLEKFPIWDDVQTFDGRPWRGCVDIISGGFPCQDISSAGKGAGINGEKSGLWREYARIIGEVRPRHVWVENSPVLTSRGLDRVCGDLAALGYDARWGVVSAADAIWASGTPAVYHKRERIWIHAYSGCSEGEQQLESAMLGGWTNEAEQTGMGDSGGGETSDCDGLRQLQSQGSIGDIGRRIVNGSEKQIGNASFSEPIKIGKVCEWSHPKPERNVGCSWWLTEPELGRVVHGVANRMDRLRAIGNGQVPAVVVCAWRELRNDESNG